MLIVPVAIIIPGICLVYASPFPEDNTTIKEMANSSYLLGDNDVVLLTNNTNNMGNETSLVNESDILVDDDFVGAP
jgi:hypothetical protein